MRERTRRQLCQLLFVAGCVLPTLSTFSWAAYRLSPWHAARERAAWEDRLFHDCGLIARVGGVEHPGEGSVLLSDVTLLDPDGDDQVLHLRKAEFDRTPQGTVVRLSQPEVARGKLARLSQMLHDRVLRGRLSATPLQVTTHELTLEVGPHAQTFTELCCTVERRDAGVHALVEFNIAGSERPAPAALQILRNRQTSPPSTLWQLTTGGPIPCSLFSDYLPGVARLGARAEFEGTVSVVESSAAWTAELKNGRFVNVDLDSLTEPFPHRMGGTAAVAVERALFRQGLLAEAHGEIVSAGGTVSTSLLASLAEHLGAGAALRTAQPQVPYSELACEFRITPSGVTLGGRCRDGRPGTLLASPFGELLITDPHRAYRLVEIVRAMSPDSQWLVPATREARSLLAVLPLPTRQEAREALARDARLRLRPRQPPTPSTGPSHDSRTGSGTPGGPGRGSRDQEVLPAGHYDSR